jgi:hypothetical protein
MTERERYLTEIIQFYQLQQLRRNLYAYLREKAVGRGGTSNGKLQTDEDSEAKEAIFTEFYSILYKILPPVVQVCVP